MQCFRRRKWEDADSVKALFFLPDPYTSRIEVFPAPVGLSNNGQIVIYVYLRVNIN
jgi:hypothetical protein